MANHISHAALPYPIRGARFTAPVLYFDSSGVPTNPSAADTEASLDGAAFADCAEEATVVSDGAAYITLTGAETDCSLLAVLAKSGGGANNSLFSLSPRKLPTISSGTLSAGSASGGTLGTILAFDISGCFIRTTGGTGGGGTGGANNQARRIATYTPSTGAFTVSPNWETTPDNTTTYEVLLPEGHVLSAVHPDARIIEGSYTELDAIRLMLAVLCGKASGGGTATMTFRDTGDSANRVVASVDSSGNRTSVTLTP